MLGHIRHLSRDMTIKRDNATTRLIFILHKTVEDVISTVQADVFT